MIIGEPDYYDKLIRLSMGSNGAVDLEYLEHSPIDRVLLINNTVKSVSEELSDG